MLTDRPEEQETIFREILLKKMSVREVERIVRKIASDKVRKKQHTDIGDHLIEIEKEFTETLGTRVQIQKTEFGGKLTIDYFSEEDLEAILKRMQSEAGVKPFANTAAMAAVAAATPLMSVSEEGDAQAPNAAHSESQVTAASEPSEPVAPASYVPPAPVSPQPQPEPQPQRAPVADSYERPAQPEPVAPAQPVSYQHEPTQSSVQPQQPVAPAAPTADPSLLERLAAHTSFGFSRPAPVTHAHPVVEPPQVPVAEQQPAPVDRPTAPVPPVAPTPAASVQSDESEDIYSVRNFSI